VSLRSSCTRLASGLRPFVRDLAAEVLHHTHLIDPARLAQHKLTIATFHRVLTPEQLASYPLPGLALTPTELDWLLAVFKKHYTPGPLREMATRFALGDRPEKPLLALTFDDGQRDNFQNARDVLDKHDVRASFFVVTDTVERDETLWHDRVGYALSASETQQHALASDWIARLGVRPDIIETGHTPEMQVQACVSRLKTLPTQQREALVNELEARVGGGKRPAWDGMMTWAQLRELHTEGHEIGSHSQSHAILTLTADAQLEREVFDSRQHLERELGIEIDTFCYPNGDCDARVVSALQRAGYRHAVTTRYGLNDGHTSHYLWKRCDMQSRHARTQRGRLSEGRILLRLSGLLPSMR